jgi:hypothetical protein
MEEFSKRSLTTIRSFIACAENEIFCNKKAPSLVKIKIFLLECYSALSKSSSK